MIVKVYPGDDGKSHFEHVDPKDWHSVDKVNTRVEAVFDDVSDDWTFVRWRSV